VTIRNKVQEGGRNEEEMVRIVASTHNGNFATKTKEEQKKKGMD
jgi:hypothetical protein